MTVDGGEGSLICRSTPRYQDCHQGQFQAPTWCLLNTSEGRRHLQRSQKSGCSISWASSHQWPLMRGQSPAFLPQSEDSLKGHPRPRVPGARATSLHPISASAQSCIPPSAADTAPRSAPETAVCCRPRISVSVSQVEDTWLHLFTGLVKADFVKWQIPSVFHNGHNSRDVCKRVLRMLYTGRPWASTNQNRGLCDQPAHLDQCRQAFWIFQQLANSFLLQNCVGHIHRDKF